jgi:cyclase
MIARRLAVLALFAAAPAFADQLPFDLKAIGAGVYAAIDGPEHKSGSNAGFVIGDDGVVVIDSFFNEDAAKALVAEIRKLTAKPIRFVVNTHYHIDHTGGDRVLREAGAVIVAHRNVRGWLHDENIHLFGDRITEARRAQIDALVPPDLTTDKDLTIWLGSRRVEVRTVEGHTGGDLVIAVPDSHALFCGDMLWRHVSPNLIDGTVKSWVATVHGFQQGPDKVFVPGHGDVATVKDVAEFESYLAVLSALTADGRGAGLEGEALVEAVTAKMRPQFGDWASFEAAAPREIRYMDAELAGNKRIPLP